MRSSSARQFANGKAKPIAQERSPQRTTLSEECTWVVQPALIPSAIYSLPLSSCVWTTVHRCAHQWPKTHCSAWCWRCCPTAWLRAWFRTQGYFPLPLVLLRASCNTDWGRGKHIIPPNFCHRDVTLCRMYLPFSPPPPATFHALLWLHWRQPEPFMRLRKWLIGSDRKKRLWNENKRAACTSGPFHLLPYAALIKDMQSSLEKNNQKKNLKHHTHKTKTKHNTPQTSKRKMSNSDPCTSCVSMHSPVGKSLLKNFIGIITAFPEQKDQIATSLYRPKLFCNGV